MTIITIICAIIQTAITIYLLVKLDRAYGMINDLRHKAAALDLQRKYPAEYGLELIFKNGDKQIIYKDTLIVLNDSAKIITGKTIIDIIIDMAGKPALADSLKLAGIPNVKSVNVIQPDASTT